MSSPIKLFVNGCLQITELTSSPDDQTDTNYSYVMRFLTETDGLTTVKIALLDDQDNLTECTHKVKDLQIIKVDCTDYMYKFNWQNNSYIRIRYVVYIQDTPITNGSFPLIAPSNHQPLSIISVSNNLYPDTSDLWRHISNSRSDIILHTGGQIDGTPIVDGRIGIQDGTKYNTDTIYNTYADLYRKAYSNTYQAEAMRNCLNVMIIGDVDVCKNFATRSTWSTKSNQDFTAYYVAATTAYLNYQHQLHSDLDTLDLNSNSIKQRILTGDHPIYYSLEYGKYLIASVDQRHELYHSNQLFSDQQLYWLQYSISESSKRHIIINSSHPIGELNKYNAQIHSILSVNCLDEPLHPHHYQRTLQLFTVLKDVIKLKRGPKNKRKTPLNIILISGGQKSYINRIYRKKTSNNNLIHKKLLFTQLVCGSVSNTALSTPSKLSKLSNWLQHKMTCYRMDDYDISSKECMSTNNSYGILEDDTLSNYTQPSNQDTEDSDYLCSSIYIS